MSATTTIGVDGPGVYTMPDSVYHADPYPGGSLSCSEARLLLECPARYRYRKDHGPEYKDDFDFGHAAHTAVLGIGAPVDIIDADDWRTKDAKTQRDEARAAGRTPVLAKDWQIVEAMAAQLRAHPLAARLLDPDNGQPEQSMFWTDPATGIALRARVDWLPNKPDDRRLILPDYKTTREADRRSFARAAADYGYHQQAAWYLDGIRRLWDVDNPAFVFIVQEKVAPYLVNVIELDATALDIGRDRNRRAINRFIECTTTNHWPAYSDDVELASLPRWAEIQHEEEYGNDQF